jgi:hypothetical protein
MQLSGFSCRGSLILANRNAYPVVGSVVQLTSCY